MVKNIITTQQILLPLLPDVSLNWPEERSGSQTLDPFFVGLKDTQCETIFDTCT